MCYWKHHKWLCIVIPFHRQERWGSERLSNLSTLRQLVVVLGFKPRFLVYTAHISFLSVAPCWWCLRLLQFPIWCTSPKQLPKLCWHLSHNRIPPFFQFSSVAQSYPTLCNPMDCSTPGLPVHHQLLEFTQTHVHWVSDAIQPPHPLVFPSPPAFNLCQHQGLFQWVSSLHQVAKALLWATSNLSLRIRCHVSGYAQNQQAESLPHQQNRGEDHTQGLRLTWRSSAPSVSAPPAPLWRPPGHRPSVSAWRSGHPPGPGASPHPPAARPGPPGPCCALPGSAAGRAKAPPAWAAPGPSLSSADAAAPPWLSRTARGSAPWALPGQPGPGAPAAAPGRHCARPPGPATGPGTGWHPRRPRRPRWWTAAPSADPCAASNSRADS